MPTRLRARCLHRQLAQIPPGPVVDFGAGTGVYSYYLSRNALREVLAVDIDRKRVADINEVARITSRSRLKAICATEDFFSNRSDQSLAGILAIEILVYCDDAVGVLRSIHLSLADNGILIGHVPVRKHLFAHERHLIDQGRLGAWLREAGFEKATIQPSLGRGAERLCAIFETAASRPMLLAIVFPLLLLLTYLTRCQPHTGNSLLFVARKADVSTAVGKESAATSIRAF